MDGWMEMERRMEGNQSKEGRKGGIKKERSGRIDLFSDLCIKTAS